MKFLPLFVLSFLTCANLLSASRHIHKIPQIDGTFRFMSDSEIKEEIENDPKKDAYDPFTDIVYHFYSPQNPLYSQIVEVNNVQSLRMSNFDPKRPTKLVVHGWAGNINSDNIQFTKREYVQHNVNFFGVDWGQGAKNPIYLTARYKVEVTGEAIAKFIEFLIRDGGARLEDFLPIGHSLGGHIVGYIGRYLKKTVGELPVIISLDPAGPLFSLDKPDGRITDTDAKYVEIIHTGTSKQGFLEPIGDADFYPNGGKNQPGCGLDLTGNCDHQFAVAVMAESINSQTGFWGLECRNFENITNGECVDFRNNWNVFGGEPVTVAEGPRVYWFATAEQSPLALGKNWWTNP